MFLILGLGNPGPRYELTRHNIGFLVADNLAEKYGIDLTHHKYNALYGTGVIQDCRVMVAKPMTYMNRSGRSAKSISTALQILPEQIIVVHDDIDLPLGKIKIRGSYKPVGFLCGRSGRHHNRLPTGLKGIFRCYLG